MTVLNSIANFVYLKCYCGYTYFRQWHREAEENAEQRCTIENAKEQITDMSKQLE